MKFLALTSLQAGLLAALVAGTVIALYFLKLRHQRVFVPSSLLWQRVLDDRQSHSLRDKLRKLISILLAVTIALLIAMSLGRPEVESITGKKERIVVVLDTSPTMATVARDGKTRWEHAVTQALALLSTGGPASEYRIADTSGRMVAPFTSDRLEARTLIQQMSPTSAEPHFPQIDGSDSRVYFISDGVALPDLPKGIRCISVFQPAKNIGITAFEIRSVPSTPIRYEAYLEVQNFSVDTAVVHITLGGNTRDNINKTVQLAANEILRETFDLSKFEGGGIRAAIQSTEDAFPDDNIAFAYLPTRKKTRVMLVTAGNIYLERVLKLDPYVELSMRDPGSFHETPDCDAYIFDRFAPQTVPSRPALLIGAPAAPWLRNARGVVRKPVVTWWSEDHPLMRFVSLHDLSIEQAARIDPSDLTVIAASNRAPLIMASEKPKWVLMAFDLASSDFIFQAGFPIFIENTLAWFGREQLALRRSPGTVEIPLSGAQIRTMDGKAVASERQLQGTIFEATKPGLYTASQGEAQLHVAVNLASRRFSDVNRTTFNEGQVWSSQKHWLQDELWRYMLLLAVLLIGAEWFTYHRRITL